jgi:glycosyltransferase involved in cell wall biosynthesis
MRVEGNKNMSFICFGGEDWWYKNRGHIDMQLMRRFARLGTTLYVNSIVMQKPNFKKATGGGRSFSEKFIRKTKSILMGLQKVSTGFWVYSPLSIPAHHIGWLKTLNEIILRLQLSTIIRKLRIHNPVIWVACPAACEVAIKMKKSKLVYQRTDRFEEYPNVDSKTIQQYDQKLKANADLTIFVNNKLYAEEANQCRKSLYLDHGVDFEKFAFAEKDPNVPSDMVNIPKPIIGYFGAIDSHSVNIALATKIAELLPEMSFVYVGTVSSDCSELTAKRNVWMLGQKDYEEIPHYGKCFDVAILPWIQNRWTEAANPIKVKEYLALGKPFVSTPVFTQIQEYLDVAYVAEAPEEFADCIKKALSEDSPERITARRKKVEKDTWNSKADRILCELFE